MAHEGGRSRGENLRADDALSSRMQRISVSPSGSDIAPSTEKDDAFSRWQRLEILPGEQLKASKNLRETLKSPFDGDLPPIFVKVVLLHGKGFTTADLIVNIAKENAETGWHMWIKSEALRKLIDKIRDNKIPIVPPIAERQRDAEKEAQFLEKIPGGDWRKDLITFPDCKVLNSDKTLYEQVQDRGYIVLRKTHSRLQGTTHARSTVLESIVSDQSNRTAIMNGTFRIPEQLACPDVGDSLLWATKLVGRSYSTNYSWNNAMNVLYLLVSDGIYDTNWERHHPLRGGMKGQRVSLDIWRHLRPIPKGHDPLFFIEFDTNEVMHIPEDATIAERLRMHAFYPELQNGLLVDQEGFYLGQQRKTRKGRVVERDAGLTFNGINNFPFSYTYFNESYRRVNGATAPHSGRHLSQKILALDKFASHHYG